MATFSSLIQQTIRRLSMVDGTGVQIYAEEVIADILQHKFDTVFDEVFWKQFTSWEQFTLDGTLGVVTADVSAKIKRFDDIGAIYPENSNTTITEISSTINPFVLTGTSPIHYDSYPSDNTKVFHIWPKTATGNIVVHYRTKPDDFVENAEVNFDTQVLVTGACYEYLETDGSNPGATDMFKNMFESRLIQLKKLHDDAPISLDPVIDRPQTFNFVELP